MEGASIIMICPSSDARLNPVYALVTSSRKHFMLSTQIEFLQPPLFWTIDHIYHWSFLIAVKGVRDKIEELCFFFLQRSLWKELSFYLTSDVFEANFGVPWMDVYDSLDVVRQGDLNAAHKVEGQPLLEKKIAPTYGELAAFAHNEQAWHAMRSFPASSIGSSTYIGASLSSALVRRSPGSKDRQRCSFVQLILPLLWDTWEVTIRRGETTIVVEAPPCFEFTQRLPHFPPSLMPWFRDCC